MSGHLCPRCGAVERVVISATQSRCAECGLGSTSQPLVMVSDPAKRIGEEEGIARLQRMMGEQAQQFETAAFAPFALDDRWTGVRSFSGYGGSNGETVQLSLAHGDPFDPAGPLVRVETRKPRHVGLDGPANPRLEHGLLTAELVGRFRELTGRLDDDVRAAAFPYQDAEAFAKDPTAPWDAVTIPVDGTPTTCKVLTGDGDDWVASVRYDDRFIGITARHWPLADTGLVPVTEFDVYASGSVENAARVRRRHQPPE